MSSLLLPILQAASSAIETQSAPEAPSALGLLIGLAFFVVILAAMWKIYTKAGEPGWAVIVPFYNFIVLLRIIGKPWWWLLLCFIPFVNFVMLILIYVGLAKSFGKGVGFGIGLILLSPIFIPILGFGSAQYQGAKG